MIYIRYITAKNVTKTSSVPQKAAHVVRDLFAEDCS